MRDTPASIRLAGFSSCRISRRYAAASALRIRGIVRTGCATLSVGESLQVMFVSSTSSPMKLTVFASSANTVFFRRRAARNMRICAAISTSDLMLIKHYLQWGTRLKFCQQVRNGSIGRSQPGRDGAVSVGGDVPSCMSSCMPQAVSCIHMSVVGIQVETTRSGGWRISASDDDNALIE